MRGIIIIIIVLFKRNEQVVTGLAQKHIAKHSWTPKSKLGETETWKWRKRHILSLESRSKKSVIIN